MIVDSGPRVDARADELLRLPPCNVSLEMIYADFLAWVNLAETQRSI